MYFFAFFNDIIDKSGLNTYTLSKLLLNKLNVDVSNYGTYQG